jgi:hypothetical protein
MSTPEDDTTDDARLIVASLTAPRFRGRQALIDLARRGDKKALDVLEMTPEQRELALRKGVLSPAIVKALALPIVEEIARIRRERKELGKAHRDVLAARAEGNVLQRATLLAFKRALADADFRTTKHAHKTIIKYVEPGQAGVQTTSESVWASQIPGLSAAYQKRAYRVTTSEHVWSVSPEILKVPPGRRWDGTYLWITPNLRVRQGRGTALVAEKVR